MMQGQGGSVGPDLSQLGTRFSQNAMVTAILSPSDAISDQYAATVFTLKEGGSVVGRIIEQDEETVTINQNPFDLSQTTTLQKADIESEKLSPASIMPAGLINRLNGDEVVDLIAYLVARGDPGHEMFTGEEAATSEE
jgi:putative heme-binding domain-containing protein